MTTPKTVPLSNYRRMSESEMKTRAAAFYGEMKRRRSVRAFSDKPVPRAVIEDCLRTAGAAPSGANRQPWRFVVVSDAAVKRRIREAAERVEREFYDRRASKEFIDAVSPLGVDANKPFLETASHLIAVFVQRHQPGPGGETLRNYYSAESVGIAAGFLIAAIHNAGLACLPYTPSPMRFLNEILGRPESERPMMILVVGHPAEDATVPDIEKKPLEEIATFV